MVEFERELALPALPALEAGDISLSLLDALPVYELHAQDLGVELDRLFQVLHPDPDVDELGLHFRPHTTLNHSKVCCRHTLAPRRACNRYKRRGRRMSDGGDQQILRDGHAPGGESP